MLDTQKLGATLNGKTLAPLLVQGEGLMPRKDASTPAQPCSLTYNGDGLNRRTWKLLRAFHVGERVSSALIPHNSLGNISSIWGGYYGVLGFRYLGISLGMY